MKRKGIVLAGGSGTRLHPLTQIVCKQLLPVYDKPMIFYPISTLMQAGIRDILLISTPKDLKTYHDLLGDGSTWGLSLTYAIQEHPGGLAQAFLIAEEFLAGHPSCLVLGDNILHAPGLGKTLKKISQHTQPGALVFAYYVEEPQRYGVVQFNAEGKVIDLIEKPKKPPSSYAVPGLYFYDEQAVAYAKELTPSARGELEITDLNRRYLKEGTLWVKRLEPGTAWLDAGTHASIMDAAQYIRILEERQGLKVGCLEATAYEEGFIDQKAVLRLAEQNHNNSLGPYLRHMIAQEEAVCL